MTGAPSPALPVKPVCAVTLSMGLALGEALAALEPLMGAPEAVGRLFPFDFTDYYLGEMGPDLRKAFLSFGDRMDPDELPALKLGTNEIEGRWSSGGRRRVNLDPGYMTSAKLVLASTKDFAHRVYLGDGVYGDVQLQFRHGRWRPNAWTFPDYRTAEARAFFAAARDRLNQQERRMRHGLP
jgi:hypothetical protein